MNQLLSDLQEILGIDRVLTGDQLADRYVHIWEMDQPLDAVACLLPESTAEVSKIMQVCHRHNQPVIVQGGLTNLVGSTETRGDEVIISTERMNKIEEVDDQSRTMTVQAGVILERVHAVCEEHDLLFPLTFGAKGSARVGGIISTNAGGLRVLKYGMTRQQILGLEVVLADGTILSSLKKIIKDNSAYDLKQLFIGSEGTLGVVTKAVLQLIEKPQSRCSAFVGINSYEKVVSFLKYIDKGLAGQLSGYELIWQECYRAMTSPPALMRPPLVQDYPYYVLVESLGMDQEKDQAHLQSLLERALEQELVVDAALADGSSDMEWFWQIREDVSALAIPYDYTQHFDVSMPISKIGETISSTTKGLLQIEGVLNVFTFGHVADGNIHYVVAKENSSDELRLKINDTIYPPLQAIGGSVSAEHGIGSHKKAYLHLCRTPEEITTMMMLKSTLDPRGLLNPGKVLG